MIAFGPFRLDEELASLWRGNDPKPLRAKSFAVLRELVRHRGRLVSKDELFRTCWPNTAVSPTVLRVCISEIRAALVGDGAGSVSIESVAGRGYRLQVRGDALDAAPPPLVGRDGESRQLRRALARSDAGLRHVVFVRGEAGAGKTTLLERFVEDTRGSHRTLVAWGQCMELTGGTDPYFPILDLLGRLGRADARGEVLKTLRRWAPSWLLRLPGLVDGADAEELRRRVPTPNRDRMLSELGAVFEALSADRTLLLVVEDLHWSDSSSLDALAYLALHSKPARILLVGSYRSTDGLHAKHPLRVLVQSLMTKGRASDVPLAPLTPSDVEAYLRRRLGGEPFDPQLGREIHLRSRGNPLFMAATVDYLCERGTLAMSDGRWGLEGPLDGIIPTSLRQLARLQLDPLTSIERCVLDVASVVGVDFDVAAVAAAAGLTVDEAEDVCAEIAVRNELISTAGLATWPDATVSSRYAFRHVLYREVLEEALAPARRRRLHRLVGELLEVAWGDGSGEISATLAVHFEAAGDADRTVRHRMAAARAAKSRFADREVVAHLRVALTQLAGLPESRARMQTELACLLDLGGALAATRGTASDEIAAVHQRALALAEALELPLARFQAQSALYAYTAMRAELQSAREIAEQLLATAESLAIPFLTFVGHVCRGATLFNLGEFEGAELDLERAHTLWRPEFPSLALDPVVLCRAMRGFALLLRGHVDPADESIRSALDHAATLKSRYNESYSQELAAQYYATRGERALALVHADAAAALAAEHGFVVHAAVAAVVRSWAVGDVGALRRGIADYEGAGQFVGTSLFRALLVEVLLAQDLVQEARDELAAVRAFVERSRERRHLPELLRLEGECLLRSPAGADEPTGGPAACFGRAVVAARNQGALFWESRAEASLAALSPGR